MDVIYDIKQNFNKLQPKLMDTTFYVSLLGRVVYTMITTPQSFSVQFFI